MVLQFRSIQDCLDFSDHFLALNPAEEAEDDYQVAGEESLSLEAENLALAADRDAVTAHLVRLVHDPSFEVFVRNMESSLQSTVDGEQILQSWVERDFGQPPVRLE